MLNLFDSHIHTDNSPDGTHSATFICEHAAQNGLMGIAITDHCEINEYREGGFEMRMLQSVFEARKAQLSFGGRLIVSAGIELGQPLLDPLTAHRALEAQKFDFVLGSVHLIEGYEDFYYMDYSAMSVDELDKLMGEYFESVCETVRVCDFDVLAHLTYPLRYIRNAGIEYDINRQKPAIDGVLKELIKCGKGLELNTSGLCRGQGNFIPHREVFCRYRELGGRLVTIGSDSHRAEHVGNGIPEGMELLKSCGFSEFAFYKKRAPRLLEIK